MTKVLYITTAYPRSESDIITPWLVETINRLRKDRIDVRVLTSSYHGLGNQTIFGTPVIRFRYFPKRWEDLTHDETAIDRVKKGLMYKFLAFSYLILGSLAAWRTARHEKPDIIHVHWPLPHSLFGWAAAVGHRAPMVISFHGAELMAVRHGMRFMRPFLQWAIRSAGAVTANSTHTVRAIQQIHNRPVTILPYGTTAGEYSGETRLPPRPVKQLMFAGRLVERKGVSYLVQAAELLAKELPVHLNIVGTGPEGTALKELVGQLGIERLVTFHGFVSNEVLEAQYRSSDVFVLPAIIDSKGDTEGLGVVLIDAMSHRKPVVASGVGGIVDLVIHERTGLQVPPADAMALAQALRRVLTDEALAERLGAAGFEHIRQNYSWDAIITRLEGIYGDLLTQKNRR